MARVLVLRDRRAASETAAGLCARGHEPLLLPMQEIVALDAPPPAGPFAAVVATSRNALPAVARHFEGSRLPVLAVGGATAALLAAAGLANVRAGKGSAASLVAPAAALARDAGLPLLLALGRVRMPVLEDGLAGTGAAFVLWETYDTRALHPGPAEIALALGGRAPDAVLILSEGQAADLAGLVRAAAPLFRPMPRLLCLSARIAAALPEELRSRASISDETDLDMLFESLASTKFAY